MFGFQSGRDITMCRRDGRSRARSKMHPAEMCPLSALVRSRLQQKPLLTPCFWMQVPSFFSSKASSAEDPVRITGSRRCLPRNSPEILVSKYPGGAGRNQTGSRQTRSPRPLKYEYDGIRMKPSRFDTRSGWNVESKSPSGPSGATPEAHQRGGSVSHLRAPHARSSVTTDFSSPPPHAGVLPAGRQKRLAQGLFRRPC